MVQTTIAHFSDTYLGKHRYGSDDPPDDFLTAFERSIDGGVDDDRNDGECAGGERVRDLDLTARNAVETAALRSFRRRWGRDGGGADRHGDNDERRDERRTRRTTI